MKKYFKNSFYIFVIVLISIIFYGSSFLYKHNDALATAVTLHLEKSLNDFYSDKQLGSFVEDGKTYFRLFTPNAVKVLLYTFDTPSFENGKEYQLERDEDGVWEITLEGERYGLYYGYKVYHKNDKSGTDKVICLDPYAKAVATFNTYMNPRLAIVVKDEDYDWEGTDWVKQDWRDLIIYEMQIRDMTAHHSSGVAKPGTYHGLIEKEKKGGIDYIKELGINTVELLPAQEFGNIEIPFNKEFAGRKNTWNPYERNHWGYMTAAFFAPEAYFSEDWKELKWNTWMGTEGKQVNHFKDMVKAFHKEGIAVIMDVVYNHISEYELGNLKEIDKEYYFRLDDKGNFRSESGCGNDFKTERPMARRLIVESVLFWMKEYKIDGFRFDLGKLIDWVTIETIIREAQKINPNVVIVCEPWGGGYDPKGFSLRGWGSWNDQIRNGVKGENPVNGHGWIFGKWYGNNNPDRIKSYINGTLTRDKHGLFLKKEHSVNYLESHDGYTLGDFIRIGINSVSPTDVIKNSEEIIKLTPEQLKLNKLAAMFLFTSQGMTMIHSGQEYARSKIIPIDIDVPDSHKGMLDHNSYEKDNETNYLNYDHTELNRELLEYYKGLIQIRKEHPAFRRAEYEQISFVDVKDNPFVLLFSVRYNQDEYIVMMNASSNLFEQNLPDGKWKILANEKEAIASGINVISGNVSVNSKTGIILQKEL